MNILLNRSLVKFGVLCRCELNDIFQSRVKSLSNALVKKFSDSAVEDSVSDREKIPKFQNLLAHLDKSLPLFSGTHQDLTEQFQKLQQSSFSKKYDELFENGFDVNSGLYVPRQWYQRKLFLESRDSMLSTNSALLFPDLNLWRKKVSMEFSADYITALILASLEYSNINVNSSLFGFCRVPSLECDVIQRTESSKTSVIISREGNYFLIELNDQLDEASRFTSLKQAVRFILQYKNPSEVPVGILSSLPRGDREFAYKFLNPDALKRIREAKLMVSLDQIDSSDSVEHVLKQVLHSDRANVGNRWMERSAQLVFVLAPHADEIYGSGVCFDQAQVTSMLQVFDWMEHCVQFLTKFKPLNLLEPEEDFMIKLHKLDLVDDQFREVVTESCKNFAASRYRHHQADIELGVFTYTNYGAELIEANGCLVESWLVQAINAAWYNLCHSLGVPSVPCYQRLFDPQHDSWFQAFNEEMFECSHEPTVQKLWLALESHRFHQELAIGKRFHFDQLLLGCQHVIESNNCDNRQLMELTHPLRRQSIQTTIMPATNHHYNWLLVSSGPPLYNARCNVTTQLASNRITFVLTKTRDQAGVGELQVELGKALDSFKSILPL